MKKIGFAGSFDPITNGHMHVINEALNIAEEVHVIVSVNPSKKYMFSGIDRKHMIEDAVGHNSKIKVHLVENNYVASWLADNDINYLIRGIRNSNDFEHEKLIQRANMDVFGPVNTLFIMPPSDLESVSSSFVKGLIGPENWTHYIKKFIPGNVFFQILKNYILDNANLNIRNNPHRYKELMGYVMDSYMLPNRYYHNLEHIASMITDYKNNHKGFIIQNIIDAIIFHDVVQQGVCSSYFEQNVSNFKSYATDEEKSAAIVEYVTKECSTQEDVKNNYVSNFVKQTMYSGGISVPSEIIDLDFMILGKPANIYNEYKDNIRREYSQYSYSYYVEKRVNALSSILKMIKDNTVFVFPWSLKYKERAISNIEKEIDSLVNTY